MIECKECDEFAQHIFDIGEISEKEVDMLASHRHKLRCKIDLSSLLPKFIKNNTNFNYQRGFMSAIFFVNREITKSYFVELIEEIIDLDKSGQLFVNKVD